jgi:hypothetical protein
MDIMSYVVDTATQMQQASTAMQYSVEVAKKGQDTQKMLGNAVLSLIQSGADVAAAAQGKGTIVNLTA